MEKITLTRQDIYDLVWKEPFSVLAKKYNISDNGLRKICKRMSIPTPKMGYWQKVNFGKHVKIEPLPNNYSDKNEITLDEKSADDDSLNSPQAIIHRLTKEIESHEELPLHVSERLTNPDKMIVKAREDLTEVKRPYRSSDGLISTNAGLLDITVAPVNIPRALRLMDALIKLLRARGHEIEIHDGTILIIFDERIHFCLQEKIRFEEKVHEKYLWIMRESVPTGIFTLRIWVNSWDKKIIDEGGNPFETQLAKVLARVEYYAKKAIEYRLALEKGWREQAEKERIFKERKERIEKEIKDFKNLLKEANRWHQAKILREYIQAVENNSAGKIDSKGELLSWIKWANDKVDWYDPFIKKDDVLLGNYDNRKELLEY